MANPQTPPGENEALWREVLTHGHRSRMAAFPSSPRCTVCGIPFGGVGGTVMRLQGRKPSRKNPTFCNMCDDFMPPGGAEIDIAVLFADVRGSTGLAERLGPSAFAALLNRFYRVATEALLAHDAVLDKMIGDEVMAFFLPVRLGHHYREAAVHAAEELMRAVSRRDGGRPWLPLGIGVNAGLASVGKIGTADVHDFTALGDTVNTAARLQGVARAGEIVLSEVLYSGVADTYPGLEQRTLQLRGRAEAVTVRVLRPGP